MALGIFLLCWVQFSFVSALKANYDVWNEVRCNEDFIPDGCEPHNLELWSADEYDRCGPAYLPRDSRNFFLAAAGRRQTYKENKNAFRRINIVPRMLRGIYNSTLRTKVMGEIVDVPIGFSPTALHKLADREGEIATLKAILSMKTVMILSVYATTSIEDMAALARKGNTRLWMQTYLFQNRNVTLNIVRRAEASGFKAIVVTVDSPIDAFVTCNSRRLVHLPHGVSIANVNFTIGNTDKKEAAGATFKDLTWLKSKTKLPIVAKGILTGDDAVRAITAGASAILVSNHGGRQMDGAPATIDVLPGIVDAVKKVHPGKEIYMDGGVRSGHDIYKAIARGASMVFVGRLVIWGLALGGSEGVKDMMNHLIADFNQTMIISGASNVSAITIDTLYPPDNKNFTK